MMGMMTVDALNGVWTAWLIRRADQTAEIASKIMGAVVACLSIGVAVIGICTYLLPDFAEGFDTYGLWLGVGVLAFTLMGYLAAVKWAEPRQAR